MEWQLIESAPKDGTIILLTDGEHFAAGYRDFCIEGETKYLGYDEGVLVPDGPFKGCPQIGPRFLELVPNPNAGNRNEWWTIIGCSGFTKDVHTSDWDGSLYFEPTAWMPLPKPPEGASSCAR